jgi:hypothetical protein
MRLDAERFGLWGGSCVHVLGALQMSWLDRLLGRESYNPELYEHVPCAICGGRGVIAPSAAPADPRMGVARVRACGSCKGKGHVLRRKFVP